MKKDAVDVFALFPPLEFPVVLRCSTITEAELQITIQLVYFDTWNWNQKVYVRTLHQF